MSAREMTQAAATRRGCRARVLSALGLLAAFVLSGCERRVPPMGLMPKPPAELLADVPAAAYPTLSQAILEAEDRLPVTSGFREAATELRAGRRMVAAELYWPSRTIAGPARIIREALAAMNPPWPSEPGAPEYTFDAVRSIADALVVTAASYGASGVPDKDMSVCLDGLRFAAHIGMGNGTDGEAAARSTEIPFVQELARLVENADLSAALLVELDVALEEYAGRVRPLDHVLREGLSIVASVADGLPHEEWAATVRTMWRREPQRDPAAALQAVWDEWSALIRAAKMPLAEARRETKGMEIVRDEIEMLLGAPGPRMLVTRIRSARDLQRLRLMVSLELWRQARGAYPQSLAELVPSMFEAIPADAATGAAFAYRRTEQGYLLGGRRRR